MQKLLENHFSHEKEKELFNKIEEVSYFFEEMISLSKNLEAIYHRIESEQRCHAHPIF